MEREDELEEEIDENDDYDEDEESGTGSKKMEALWQASKSTKRDHFSKLQKRLHQLGKMFINQVSQEWTVLYYCQYSVVNYYIFVQLSFEGFYCNMSFVL